MITTYEGFRIASNQIFPNNVMIATEGQGGSIPNDLKGLFTSVEVAKQFIDNYLAKKQKEAEEQLAAMKAEEEAKTRSKVNAKEKPASGDK